MDKKDIEKIFSEISQFARKIEHEKENMLERKNRLPPMQSLQNNPYEENDFSYEKIIIDTDNERIQAENDYVSTEEFKIETKYIKKIQEIEEDFWNFVKNKDKEISDYLENKFKNYEFENYLDKIVSEFKIIFEFKYSK